MTDRNLTPGRQWTRQQAAILALVCMMTGIAGGWLIRGSQHTAVAVPAQTVNKAVPAAPAAAPAPTATDPAQLKQMADAQAAPLLRKLGAAPDSSELLTNLGNLYYDAQQYPTAVGYYQHALKGTPSDAAVRTDMATAYWYMGNADLAINEFNKALTYAPDSPNALFNRGLVKWKGKGDGAGAVADWKRLLAVRPNYEARDKVEQMLAEVQSHAGK